MSSRLSQTRPALGALQGILEMGARGLAWLAFWAAIALPAVYLPLWVVGRLDPALALVALHGAAVLAGQFHGPGR